MKICDANPRSHRLSLQLLSFLLLLISARLPGQGHPDRRAGLNAQIAASRAAIREVDQLVAKGRLVRRDTTFTCPNEPGAEQVSFNTDSLGRVRLFRVEGGSDDTAEQWSFYYDGSGALRAARADRGAVNGTEQLEEVFYDTAAVVLRRVRRLLKGPGFPWDSLETIRDPQAWLQGACSPGR